MASYMLDNDSIEGMAILIADDIGLARLLLEKSLRNRGFTNILAVESSERALEELEKFQPDIVILDVMMPGMDGFACCRTIRAIPKYKELPVLIETSMTDLSLRVKAFESGATDFISNPILPDELYARVRVHLQNRKYINELQNYKERVTQELRSAFQLQVSILPQENELEAVLNLAVLM